MSTCSVPQPNPGCVGNEAACNLQFVYSQTNANGSNCVATANGAFCMITPYPPGTAAPACIISTNCTWNGVTKRCEKGNVDTDEYDSPAKSCGDTCA